MFLAYLAMQDHLQYSVSLHLQEKKVNLIS